MQPSSTPEASSSTDGTVNAQLAQLVPIFDPGTDSLEVWSQKVELLIQAWPTSKLQELGTRIILNCRGTAFKKLQLRQSEILTGEKKGILKAIEILGGTYGQVALEQKFEVVERAIYRCLQKSDEASDSFLARADISWTELIAKKVSLEEVQAYVILRGSRLTSEDKKRVLVESGAEKGGILEMSKVTAAIRMLGSQFFQEYTTGKREKGLKTYDHTTLVMEEGDDSEGVFWSQEEMMDEEALESLAAEDEDAALILQFEGAVLESIQEDADLAAFYSSYVEARRRLNEKAKARGFWPVSKGSKGGGFRKGAKGKSKGKGTRSLAQRIAESSCRICGQVGHWKAECPSRKQGSEVPLSNVAPTTAVIEVSQTSSSSVSRGIWLGDPTDEILMAIPEMDAEPWKERGLKVESADVYFVESKKQNFANSLKQNLIRRPMFRDFRMCKAPMKPLRSQTKHSEMAVVSEECTSLFASSGTSGVVDLGASQTVIGSEQMKELLEQLPSSVRQQIRKASCNLTFRFGNHQTLPCRHAVLFPLQGSWFRVAIVEGKTPFLLSSNFLRHTLKAVIDTDECTLWSKTLGKFLTINPTQKNLFLLDINQLWETEHIDFQETLQVQESSTLFAQEPPFESRGKIKEPRSSKISQENSPPFDLGNPKNQKVSHVDSEVGSKVDLKQCQQKIEDPKIAHPQSLEHQSDLCPKFRSPDVEAPRSTESLSKGPESADNGADESRGNVKPEDRFRQGKIREDLHRSLRRPSLDSLHCEHLRNEHKAGAHGLHPLREKNDLRERSAQHKHFEEHGQEEGDPEQDGCPGGTLTGGLRSVGSAASRTSVIPLIRPDPHRATIEPSREPDGRGGHVHAQHGSSERTLESMANCEDGTGDLSNELLEKIIQEAMMAQSVDKPELDFEISTDPESMSYAARCRKLINQMKLELEEVKRVIKPSKTKTFLFEIMCSPTSEVVRQCWMQGLKACRFGQKEGDLSTVRGRKNLFAHLIALSPEHVWISPECRPWCKWSAFNMMRSPETCQKILKDRYDSLWQVALTRILFDHQAEEEKHFHAEQPEGSTMFSLPSFGPILSETLQCKFDLCTVGNLKDPSSGTAIRKRLQVVTSSKTLFDALHFRFCKGEHEHKHIAGTSVENHKTISMSRFTEKYPRKFARQIVQALQQGHPRPVWTLMQTETDEHPTKRRRVGMKASPLEIALRNGEPSWEEIMKLTNLRAKRVGVSIEETGQLIDAVQRKCPNHEVKHIVLCRGTDRLLGPNKVMHPGEATLRKSVCIRRRHEDIVEEPWEPWERMSFRKLRRKGTPARVSLTIFANPKPEESISRNPLSGILQSHLDNVQEENPARENPNASERQESEEAPSPKRSRRVDHVSQSHEKPDESHEEVDRNMIDMISQKHGPEFQKLTSEEKSWLLKVHRNLGHPGVQKMQAFCKQVGCSQELLQALPDMKCSTCIESKGPMIPRPSAIHEERDFGDVVSVDGITWTNKAGKQFHCYHFVDHSTTFQTAWCSPSRTTENAIRALMLGWISWAGPPGVLCMDSATEFGTEAFLSFLQKHGIKSRMIPPESSWQNSRAERHGGILQEILKKMDIEEEIKNYDDFEQALMFATQTKNQWSRHRGFPPEMLVFGKLRQSHGSVISDSQIASNSLASAETPEGIRFRQELASRERARLAFSKVDNTQAMRRAMLQRSRPSRGQYFPGEWIMIWRKEGHWLGPLKVIVQEDKHVLWASMGNRLFRAAPEQVRPLSAVEECKLSPKETSNTDELQNLRGINQFTDVSSEIPIARETQRETPRNTTQAEETNVRQISEDQPDREPEVGPQNSDRSIAHENTTQAETLPENIPVPDSDEDELWCETFALQENFGWQFELEVGINEMKLLANDDIEENLALLVSNAKKQRAEVKMKELTKEDMQLFEEAKQKEVKSWLDTGAVCRILRNRIPVDQVLRCRWILTWKDGETNSHLTNIGASTNAARKAKARIVVLGFEDPMLHEIERDSPTLTKLGRSLILQYAASQQWQIGSFDVKTAFLRGSEQNDRILGIEPPPELRRQMGLKDEEICRLLKGAYGRADAPLLWFKELQKGLTELGFSQSPFDPCVFTLNDEEKNTIGLIGVHVDDGLCCGNDVFHQKLKLLEQKYPFGSQKKTDFVFTGLHVQQHADMSISVDQTQYVKDISPIQIPWSRKQCPEDAITDTERQSLRAVIGSLLYASVNTRPDLGSRLSYLQGKINNGQVKHLSEANKILHDAKAHANVQIRYQNIPIKEIRFVAFSDASFASEKNHSSHQGMLIMAAHQCIGKNEISPVNPILWASRKIQKVAVSTLSAEAMALAGAVDTLAWVRLFWAWLIDNTFEWRLGDKSMLKPPEAFSALKDEPTLEEPNESLVRNLNLLKKVEDSKAIVATDCKSLFDLVSKNAAPSCQEFRTQLQAKLIREHVENGVQMRWVPSGAQIADALTKIMDPSVLREYLKIGRYKLHDETSMLKQRSDARVRIQWLRQNHPA